jgi:hypothetical protein
MPNVQCAVVQLGGRFLVLLSEEKICFPLRFPRVTIKSPRVADR